ncbi:S41 family peptidase [Bacteroides sp.]|uniref:S41 family peptidase n=1 Tax=Bacteroides sp. TaxID=29523 RepID=UPI003AB408F9
MKILKIVAIVIAVLAIAWCGLFIYAKYFYNKDPKVESFYLSEMPVKASQFEADFEEIHRIVVENYSLYQAKHLNMDSLYQTYIARVRQAQTTTDYGLAVQEYISALQCSHAITSFRMYTANQLPAFIQDSLYVNKPNDYLVQYGFRDKDRIIAIDGLPCKEWIVQNEKYTEASTDVYRRVVTAHAAFRSFADTLRNYTLLRGEDTLKITLPLKRSDYFPYKEEKTVEAKILQDSIGYLAVNTMMNPVMDDFKAAYPQIKHLPYLIVDIRRNGGGNSGNGQDICKYFIRQEQLHCVGKEIMMQPEADAYKGKIYLLTGTITCSAAESFTIDMKESGNVTLVGEPTAGDTGNGPRPFSTKHHTWFRIPTREPDLSPKGFPMEGVGIPPHHQVSQTIADFMDDEDTVLKYTIGLITNK